MTEYLVVALEHPERGEPGRFMSRRSEAKFHELIYPKIGKRTLIMVEGFNSPRVIYPQNQIHQIVCRYFGTALGEKAARCAFLGVDPRQSPDDVEAAQFEQKMDAWENFVRHTYLADSSIRPESLPAAEKLIRARVSQPQLKRRPTREELGLARFTETANRDFDRNYMMAMRQLGFKFDTCILAVGGFHALSIAIQRGQSVIWTGDDAGATTFYWGYHAEYVWPTLLLKSEAAR